MVANFLALLIQQILDQVIRSSYQMYHLLDMLTMANKQMMDKQNDLPNIGMPYRSHTLRARVCLGKESNAPINLMFQTPPLPLWATHGYLTIVRARGGGMGNLNLSWLGWEILIWKYQFFPAEYMCCFNLEGFKGK